MDVGCEVWAFGRMPLAISARCYHARVEGLSKDSCRFVCGLDSDGREVDTLDGQKFLAINGVQTLSQTYCNTVADADRLAEAGVTSLRLSPHSCDMVAVARTFRDRLDGRLDADEAWSKIETACGPVAFANGFLFGETGADLAGRT
jgi:collagenase-like PrtC family protease